MVSEATTDTTQPPALTHRRFICYMPMYHILCFLPLSKKKTKKNPGKLPNNAVVWHKSSQNVHSEEKKHTKFKIIFVNLWHFWYLTIKMFHNLCDELFTSSKDPLQKSVQGQGYKKLVFWISIWFLFHYNMPWYPPKFHLRLQWLNNSLLQEIHKLRGGFLNDIVLHFVDNQQTGLKPMLLLWYLPAVLYRQMLTVMFHTSILPHYSLITLLLEVLTHIEC